MALFGHHTSQHHSVTWNNEKSHVQVRSLLQAGSHDDAVSLLRGAVATLGTQVYFSLSSYGHRCPSYPRGGIQPPHYVFSYNTSRNEWLTLPPCEVHDFGLAVVDGLVTIVGGEFDYKSPSFTLNPPDLSRRLSVLLNGEWIDTFPPMTIERGDPSVICSQQYLIVVGGVSHIYPYGLSNIQRRKTVVSSVEVMDTKTKVWSQVASLPEPASCLVAAHCGDQLYLLGGKNHHGSISSVFTCTFQALVNSLSVRPSGEKSKSENFVCWQKVADVPVLRSTCVVINGKLFAIGGRTSTYHPSSNVYCYSSSHDFWQVAGRIPTARSMCIAASVENKLVVIGGLKEEDQPTDIMEIGTLISGILA